MTSSRSLLLVGVVWVVAGMLFAGCAPQPSPTPAAPAPTAMPEAPAPTVSPPQPPSTPTPLPPTPTPVGERPQYGGILKKYKADNPRSLDPSQEFSVRTLEDASALFSQLLQFDSASHAKGAIQLIINDLAESWEQSADGRTYTFKLRSGVKFHDGAPLTAEDVKFSFERMLNPPSGVRSVYQTLYQQKLDRVEAVDATTVRMDLKVPSSLFTKMVAWPWAPVLPKHIVSTDQHAMERNPVGSGPYKFKQWISGVSIDSVRNPDYFVKGLPYLDGISTLIIRDAATQFAALRTGQVHFTGLGTRGLTPSESERFQKDIPGARVYQSTCPCMGMLAFNMKEKPFSDVRARKAVLMSYDQKLVGQLAYEGLGGIGAYMLPGIWSLPLAEMAKMPPTRGGPTPAEVAEAKKLLADAGYPQGLKINFTHSASTNYDKRALGVVEGMKKIGIESALAPLEYPGTYFNVIEKGGFQITEIPAFAGVYDPDAYLAMFTTKDPANYFSYSNPEFDQLFQRQSVILDVGERKKLVDQMQLKLWEEAVSFVTIHEEYRIGHRPEVRGYLGPALLYDNVKWEQVWLAR